MFSFIRRGIVLLLTWLLAFIFTAPHPVVAAGELDASLLTEGEKRQVIEFNPQAALQKRIFADGFVPNSIEFRTQVAGVSYAAQRAEHLRFGTVRVYYAAVGKWNDVRFAQRGAAGGSLADALLTEGERRQVIQFNPNAALQKRIFAEGFVPNSSEFRSQFGGVNYAGQRAEHLGSGWVRVYYAVVGNWGNVAFAQRGNTSASPTVTITPTSGPSGTRIDIVVRGFPARRPISVKIGAEYSEFAQEIASGWTDANGAFTGQGFMNVGTGRWVVGVHTSDPGQQIWAVSQPFTITSAPQPRLTISPTSGPENTVIGIEVNGFPANTAIQVLDGPAEGGHADVIARGRTNHLGNFATRAPISTIKGNRLGIRVVAVEGTAVQATAEFTITRTPSVSITPTSGVAGTTIQIVARDFPTNTAVTVYAGPQNSEGMLVTRGRTDGSGAFTTQYSVQGVNGMRWGISVATNDGIHAESGWFTITGQPTAQGLQYLYPTHFPGGLVIGPAQSWADEAGWLLKLTTPSGAMPADILGGTAAEGAFSRQVRRGAVGNAVTVRGLSGTLYPGEGAFLLTWRKAGQRYVIVSPRKEEDLLALAEGLTPLDLTQFRNRLTK